MVSGAESSPLALGEKVSKEPSVHGDKDAGLRGLLGSLLTSFEQGGVGAPRHPEE